MEMHSLPLEDTVYLDQGMRMGCLTFDHYGRRTMKEATPAEMEVMRRHNWVVHRTAEVPIRG